NFTKIVQRVPVRILLDPQELKNSPLRVGLSTAVRVDVRDASGPLVATAVRNTPQPTQESAGDDPAVDARIAEIIAENAGAHKADTLSRTNPQGARRPHAADAKVAVANQPASTAAQP
ncbi:MAG: hemolysin, partial [Nevskia sp.]|nr:hemolysin [Nevskia sp.]